MVAPEASRDRERERRDVDHGARVAARHRALALHVEAVRGRVGGDVARLGLGNRGGERVGHRGHRRTSQWRAWTARMVSIAAGGVAGRVGQERERPRCSVVEAEHAADACRAGRRPSRCGRSRPPGPAAARPPASRSASARARSPRPRKPASVRHCAAVRVELVRRPGRDGDDDQVRVERRHDRRDDLVEGRAGTRGRRCRAAARR